MTVAGCIECGAEWDACVYCGAIGDCPVCELYATTGEIPACCNGARAQMEREATAWDRRRAEQNVWDEALMGMTLEYAAGETRTVSS